jgi:hypothetical protein
MLVGIHWQNRDAVQLQSPASRNARWVTMPNDHLNPNGVQQVTWTRTLQIRLVGFFVLDVDGIFQSERNHFLPTEVYQSLPPRKK